MIIPKLNKGDKIGLISPANPVEKRQRQRFADGLAMLDALGLDVVPGEFIFSHTLRYTATPEEKAVDINKFMGDPSIRMLLATQGGATTNACLEYIDWVQVKKNPKIIMGLEDITVLLNAVYAKTGLITFHGPDLLSGFGDKPKSHTINAFKAVLMQGDSRKIEKKGNWKIIRPGRATGRLIGGNLPAFMKLIGTPFFPDVNDTILFFEAANITPGYAHCYFHHLKHLGIFSQIKGIIIGYNYGLEEKAYLEQLEDTLYYVTRQYDFPILKIGEFGTGCVNPPLPVGLRIRLDTTGPDLALLNNPVK